MKILLVEDTKFFTKAVVQGLSLKFNADVSVAYTRAEALKLLAAPGHGFEFAMVDIVLPDSDKGEVVDDVLAHNIPTVVFTGGISPEHRERLLEKPIVDYVLKDSPSSLNYLFNLMDRLVKNTRTDVLIVDDSRTYRAYVKTLLERYRLTVHEADGAESAMQMLAEKPQIQLTLIDHNMPKVTGVELIKRIRRIHKPEDLGIIGLSSNKNPELSVQFIKYGANDFLPKDFRHEELFCRVSQNLNVLDMVRELKAAASKDQITGLLNRRAFFDEGQKRLLSHPKDAAPLTIALLDVDHLTHINESFGHEFGDVVLKEVTHQLTYLCAKKDLIARTEGGEFAIMFANLDPAEASSHIEKLRQNIEEIDIDCGGQSVSVSCSIGVVSGGAEALEPVMKQASKCLQNAKDNGRNRAEFSDTFGAAAESRLAS